jgi:hypothetical protein
MMVSSSTPKLLNRVAILFGLSLALSATGAEQWTPTQTEFFENKIRPLFVNDCYKCHSQQAPKLKGGLSLESRENILKGGDTGPAIVPGNPDASLLIEAIRYTNEDLQMPPKGRKLSDEQIADLENWVKMGAPDTRIGITIKNPRDHWSFKPRKDPPVPDVQDKGWGQTPIDAFILAKLEEKDGKPNPPADKRTLIRRATFDLIGVPPTPEEVNNFLADSSPDAFAKVVDRLLASPHYGERWGRFWLDVARYSDTKGDVQRQKEDYRYPFAWTYRDYVIRSFNEDKPFNRFIMEQIAADKLVANTPDKSILAGMGFLTLGERFNERQSDIINDRIDVVCKGFLGLTVTCARCHDHKFDPIPTKDYYSLYGIFASCQEPLREPILGSVHSSSTNYLDYEQKHTVLRDKLAVLEGQRRENRGDKMKVKDILNQESQVRSQMVDLEFDHPDAPARAMILMDDSKPKDAPVFIRGEADNPGPVVPRQFLQILSPPNRIPFRDGSGRYELAIGVASPNNPLTARVIVNRIWLHHFGEGIVTTPDDFGNQSAPPSHPELLDYLASRFIESGWSIKKMHRLIMLSSVYQENCDDNPRFAQIDPENRLLWRANIRRMDFEEIRDSLLALGGKLDDAMGGKPVNLGSYPYSMRRTIYGFIDRHNLPEVYNQFDFANPDIETGKRYETIVPQQSLFLMNSPLVIEQAKSLVARADFKALTSDEERVKLLYELVYQRDPKSVEVELGVNFVAQSPESETVPKMAIPQNVNPIRQKRLEGSFAAIPADRQPLTPWEKYAHALLQANEAMFVN